METNVVDERVRFVRDFESGQWSMTELCERYGVSRPTGYKWLARRPAGGAGFVDRSHAPHQCPHRTSADIEGLIVAARHEYGWGAKKLRQILRTRYPTHRWPARSTFNDILDRRTQWAHHRPVATAYGCKNDPAGLPSTISPSVHQVPHHWHMGGLEDGENVVRSNFRQSANQTIFNGEW